MTLLYVSPPNPLKVQFYPFLRQTFGLLFEQNWNLFAPNPIQDDNLILVQCLTQGAPVHTDAWEDISSPLFTAFQENRFTAHDRVGRVHSGAARNYITGGLELTPIVESCRKGLEKSCKDYEQLIELVRKDSSEVLRRIASGYCIETQGASNVTSVAIRLRIVPAIPWSERDNDRTRSDFDDIEVGVFPLATDVLPSGLFSSKLGSV